MSKKQLRKVRAIRSLGSAWNVPLKENEEGEIRQALCDQLVKANLVEDLGPTDGEDDAPAVAEADDDAPPAEAPAADPKPEPKKKRGK